MTFLVNTLHTFENKQLVFITSIAALFLISKNMQSYSFGDTYEYLLDFLNNENIKVDAFFNSK